MKWTVIVPVKRLRWAKTRLRGALPEGVRHDLVLAMMRDAVSAARVCPAVAGITVVTDDRVAAAAAAALGAQVVGDVPDAGLNPALAHAAATLVQPGGRPADPGGVVALAADLPALRPGELAEALRRAEQALRRSYVTDAAGTGTVLLAAPPGVPLDPRFGPASAWAHATSGAVALDGSWPGLRRDVDTAADLMAALALGVGRHTSAIVAGIGTPGR